MSVPPVSSSAVVIEPMIRHRGLLPLVAEWFTAQWPAWYGAGGAGDVRADLAAFSGSESTLPVGLLAFIDDQPVGTGVLKLESIASHAHLSPWAAAGFVLPQWRRCGIGAALLQGLLAKARALGHPHMYCGTSTSVSLLRRCGWEVVETVLHEGEPLTIFRSGRLDLA
jgi:GNAT superfamily N-acetyltransferase